MREFEILKRLQPGNYPGMPVARTQLASALARMGDEAGTVILSALKSARTSELTPVLLYTGLIANLVHRIGVLGCVDLDFSETVRQAILDFFAFDSVRNPDALRFINEGLRTLTQREIATFFCLFVMSLAPDKKAEILDLHFEEYIF